MTEKDAWKIIKAYEDKFPNDRIQRIENLTADGMPDINGCFNGKEFWLELKCPKIPKRENTPLFGSNHKIMPNQFAWFHKQTLAGGKCGVLICCEDITILLKGYTLSSAVLKLSINEMVNSQFIDYYCYSNIKDCWLDIRDVIYNYW